MFFAAKLVFDDAKLVNNMLLMYLRVVHDAILVKHYRVEVYAASVGQWKLKAKGSLGCLNDFEDIVGNSAKLYELTTVAALTVTERHDSTEVPLSVIHYSGLRAFFNFFIYQKIFPEFFSN
ncbi:hypothetical protein WUBG_17593 [Wuchereria bancrofti]|uniref:Uncharacterized protein n=1 Tax=Wuchereria bancrofti TaxID=6293 RepID=J9ABX0_WUCBA|nr:hypothetical protein WUBG_17593 [Wuchereria bancrofti]